MYLQREKKNHLERRIKYTRTVTNVLNCLVLLFLLSKKIIHNNNTKVPTIPEVGEGDNNENFNTKINERPRLCCKMGRL